MTKGISLLTKVVPLAYGPQHRTCNSNSDAPCKHAAFGSIAL